MRQGTSGETIVVFGSGALAHDLVTAANTAGYRALRLEHLEAIEREAPEAQIAIEACAAGKHGKPEVLKRLGRTLPPDALLLADALCATARECSAWSRRPRHCVGYGVLKSLHDQSVVELVRVPETLDATLERARAFFTNLGSETRVVGDRPGLVSGRTIASLANEAARAVSNGVASEEDVDRAMQMGTNYPRGPLAWARDVGVDRILAILENLRRHEGDAYAPAPLLLELATQSTQSAQSTHSAHSAHSKETVNT